MLLHSAVHNDLHRALVCHIIYHPESRSSTESKVLILRCVREIYRNVWCAFVSWLFAHKLECVLEAWNTGQGGMLVHNLHEVTVPPVALRIITKTHLHLLESLFQSERHELLARIVSFEIVNATHILVRSCFRMSPLSDHFVETTLVKRVCEERPANIN